MTMREDLGGAGLGNILGGAEILVTNEIGTMPFISSIRRSLA